MNTGIILFNLFMKIKKYLKLQVTKNAIIEISKAK